MSSRHSATAARLRQGNLPAFPFRLYHSPDSIDDFTPEPPRRAFLAMKMGKSRYKSYRLSRLEQNPHCWYCGREVDKQTSSLDHLTPVSRGGPDAPWNLVLCCVDCNHEKADRTPAEWLADIRTEIEAAEARAAVLLSKIEEHNLIDDGVLPRVNPPTDEQDREPTPLPNLEFSSYAFHVLDQDGKTLIRAMDGRVLIHYLTEIDGLPDGLRVAKVSEFSSTKWGFIA